MKLVNGPNTGNIPHMNQPGTYKSYVILSLGFIPTREADATITKLGWTTYICYFQNGRQRVKLCFHLLLHI